MNEFINAMKKVITNHENNPYKVVNITDEKLVSHKIYSTKLIDLECKHIATVTPSNCIFDDLAKQVDYKWVILGSHRNATLTDEVSRIQSMVQSEVERPVRIVVTEDGRLWADNTHWTIAYIIKYGNDIKLKDIPFYIVNLSTKFVYSYNNSVMDNKSDIKNIVNNSVDIQNRLNNGWRGINISYTVGSLINELVEFGKLSYPRESSWFNYYLMIGSKDGFKTKEIVQVKAKTSEEALQEFKEKGYRGWWLYFTTWNIYNRLKFMYKFTDESSLDKFILDNYIGMEDPKHEEVQLLVGELQSGMLNTNEFMKEVTQLGVTLEQLHVNFGVFIRKKNKAKQGGV